MDFHPFDPPSSSPAGFFTGLAESTLAQPGPRSYKSRKYRPCDFCRARQVACKIESAPPCQLCTSHGRQCTFVERPKKKRRPNGPANTAESSGSGASASRQFPQFESTQAHLSPGFSEHYDGSQRSFSSLNSHDDSNRELHPQPSSSRLRYDEPSHNTSPEYTVDPYLQAVPVGICVRPLGSQLTRSARYIGDSGESNPCLLRHYRFNDNDECTISKRTYRRITSTSNESVLPRDKGEPPVLFMLMDESPTRSGEPRIEDDIVASARADITRMLSQLEAYRLVTLFIRFVYPYFPILSKVELFPNGEVSPSVLHTLPLSLLAAVYATALPFMVYDDLLATTLVHSPPSAHRLYHYTWVAITQEMLAPSLATLQACLLLLQTAPTNEHTGETPWRTSLVGWTVSIAQTLGLFKDCSSWKTIPNCDIRLRRRLWHAVFIMDKWTSLGAGTPSHIRIEDFDVLPLTLHDLEHSLLDPHLASTLSFPNSEASCDHFQYLSGLTMILSDIMDAFYSLRASQRTSKNFSLCLNIAHPLRIRLTAWNDSLPPALTLRHPETLDAIGTTRRSGNYSLSLAYIVATMTLFRALLRPLQDLSAIEESDLGVMTSRDAVRAGAIDCAKEAVLLIENFASGAMDAFWHSWSRSNFTIASEFLLQLLLDAESDAEEAEMQDLVARWRWAMSIGSGDGNEGSGVMSLGLLKLDGLENGTEQPGIG